FETPEQAILRLAQKARDEGVRLFRDPRDGRHYATSVSQPGRLHYVTGISCDCLGFISHQRCKHHSALLVALGWVTSDHDPEPEPINPEPIHGEIIRCPECNGLGEVDWGMVPSMGGLGGYIMETRRCRRCSGTG